MLPLFRIAFWSALLFAFTMAVLPHPPQLPGAPSDKVQHIEGFATLAALAVAAYPEKSLLTIALCLSVFGMAIELVQLIPALHRHGDAVDWAADTFAVVVILATLWAIRRLREKKAEAVPRVREPG